jgi:hypothetical protein
MNKIAIVPSSCILIPVLAGCAGTAQVSATNPASKAVDRPSELQDCVTAVGADRTQCRAK